MWVLGHALLPIKIPDPKTTLPENFQSLRLGYLKNSSRKIFGRWNSVSSRGIPEGLCDLYLSM